MPTYDYRCEATGQTFEVRHGMQERLTRWDELCEKLGMPLGDVAADAAVVKLATGGNVVKSGALKNAGPGCGAGGCPGMAMCGMGGMN